MVQELQQHLLRKKKHKVADALKKVPLLAGLTDKQLKKLAKKCYVRSYKTAEYVFYKEEPAYGLFVVLTGQVDIKDKTKHIISYTEKTAFGEFALLRKATRAADAIAANNTKVAYFFKEDLNALFLEDPKMCVKIYQNLLGSAIDALKRTH